MRLWNTIVVYDVYTIANSQEAANAAALTFIREEKLEPTQQVALESREERNVRQSWRDQKPLVGADVSDEDFDKHVKGHTTIEVFTHIYLKR